MNFNNSAPNIQIRFTKSKMFNRTIIEKICEIDRRERLSLTSSFTPTAHRAMMLYLLQLAVAAM